MKAMARNINLGIILLAVVKRTMAAEKQPLSNNIMVKKSSHTESYHGYLKKGGCNYKA
jgi:hypothetical protein